MLTVYGASDDLVEIEGDIREEFNWIPDDQNDSAYVALSDGTVIEVRYDSNGVWRLNQVAVGTSTFRHVPADGESYSDRVALEGGGTIRWALFGGHFAQPGR